MYLHIGNNRNLRKKNIVGIFDMDTATVSRITKNYLRYKEKNGETVSATTEIPKTFVLTDDGKVYFSQISTSSLIGRADNFGKTDDL